MHPWLHHLSALLKTMMGRIVKSDVLRWTKDLTKVDVSKYENLVDYVKVDLDCNADESLKELV